MEMIILLKENAMKFHHKDIQLNYEIIGEGKPVLILHGLGCNLEMMKACMEPVFLRKTGYKRIYLDLPGMGKSKCAIEYATADKTLLILKQFVKSMLHENFLIVGESYGGYLARGILSGYLEYVEGLMLLCPVVVPQSDKRNLPVESVRFEDTEFLNKLNKKDRDEFCEYAVLTNGHIFERYRNEILAGMNDIDTAFIKRLKENYEFSFDVDEKIKKTSFKKTALFICGRQDTCVGYEDLWKLIDDYPRATFSVIDVAGHNLQIEQPEVFEELVHNWLIRVEKYL